MTGRRSGGAALAPLARLLVSAVGLFALRQLGHGELAAPDGVAPGDLSAWMSQREATVVAFALLRLAAMAAGGYVLSIATLQLACCWGGRRDLAAIVDRITIPALRSVLAGAATLGISASALGPPSASAAPPPAGEEVVTMRVLRDPPTSTEPAPTTAPASLSAEPPAPAVRVSPVPSVARGHDGELWTVEPGDSFWTIAASHLSDLRGAPSTDAEIARYWRSLVDANRGILVVAGNVDLLFAGQIVTLVPLT